MDHRVGRSVLLEHVPLVSSAPAAREIAPQVSSVNLWSSVNSTAANASNAPLTVTRGR
jgi:hypothetical protein